MNIAELPYGAPIEELLLEGLASRSLPLNEAFWNSLEFNTAKIIEKHAKMIL